MPFVIEFSGVPDVSTELVTEYSFLVDGYPASSNAQQRYQDARLTILETPVGLVNGVNDTFTFTRDVVAVISNVTGDVTADGTITDNVFVFDDAPGGTAPPEGGGDPIPQVITGYVNIPIKSFSYEENDDDSNIAGVLNCELAKHDDRDVLTRDASIRFETGEKLSGTWTWTIRLDTARLSQSDYALSNKDLAPDDHFTIVATPLLQARLETSPLGLVVLHDPDKITVNESEFISMTEIDGTDHAVTIVPTTGLSTKKIADYVADVCGFAECKTNVPDFGIRRIDFGPGEPYYNALAGTIGAFEVKEDYDILDDALVLREGTNDVLPDTSAARVLTVDDLTALSDSREIGRYKGSLMTYQEQGTGWDYWTETVSYTVNPPDGLGDLVTTTEEVNRNYYRIAFPNTPVRGPELRRRTITTKTDVFTVFHRVRETYTYDNIGNLQQRTRVAESRLPDPSSSFAFALLEAENETETLTYLAHPYEAESIYCAYREIAKTGLIVTDSDNQQLGEDYSQSLLQSYRSGNLVDTLVGSTGDISNYREWQTPLPNRRVWIRTATKDHMNSGTQPEDINEVRIGDIGISIAKHLQRQRYVFDEADSTATRIMPLNVGEAPLSVGVPLATRINRRQYYPGRASMTVSGMDWSLISGRAINPKDRDGVSYGTYRITSRTITGNDGRFLTALVARQIGSADVIAEPVIGSDNVFSIALESGENRIITFSIPCYDGRELSGEAVTGLTVEARHGTGGAWTNIETTPIDLSPYAGSTGTFQVRVTAGTITTHTIWAFKLFVGPS